MKRFMFACVAALSILVFAQQQASAWTSFNFSAGVNTSFQSGGFRLLWGLFETAPGPNSQFSNPCWGKGGQQCPPAFGCNYPMDYGCPQPTITPTCAMPYSGGNSYGVLPPSYNPSMNNGVQPIGWFYGNSGTYQPSYNDYYQPTQGYYGNYSQVPAYWFNQ